ncbi:hypothetical protein E2320_004571, partial [Naja naja]
MIIKECEVNEQYIDLGEINDNDWKNIWNRRVYKNMSVRVKENGCKVIRRWYLTPRKLNQIGVKYTNVCWRCKKKVGTYKHMWWDCDSAQKIWDMVFREISALLNVNLDMSPRIALLLLVEKQDINETKKEFI